MKLTKYIVLRTLNTKLTY